VTLHLGRHEQVMASAARRRSAVRGLRQGRAAQLQQSYLTVQSKLDRSYEDRLAGQTAPRRDNAALQELASRSETRVHDRRWTAKMRNDVVGPSEWQFREDARGQRIWVLAAHRHLRQQTGWKHLGLWKESCGASRPVRDFTPAAASRVRGPHRDPLL
jgi:hypothetical protein